MLAAVRQAAALALLAVACSSGLESLEGVEQSYLARSGLALSATGSVLRTVRGAVRAALEDLSPGGPAPHDAPPVPVALDSLSDPELRARLATDPDSLETMSVGSPSRGALFNAVQLKDGAGWHVVDPERAFGAPEAIASITRAVETVNAAFPDTPVLFVGQLSSEYGGYLRPHRSHQSGRDADVGYYYRGGPRWYVRATRKTLDLERTWALVEAFAADPNVEAIFMDRSVQRLLTEYAATRGVPRDRLKRLFEGAHRGGDHLVRHEWGHLTHLHVRFECPNARAAGDRFLSVTGVDAHATGARLRSRG